MIGCFGDSPEDKWKESWADEEEDFECNRCNGADFCLNCCECIDCNPQCCDEEIECA